METGPREGERGGGKEVLRVADIDGVVRDQQSREREEGTGRGRGTGKAGREQGQTERNSSSGHSGHPGHPGHPSWKQSRALKGGPRGGAAQGFRGWARGLQPCAPGRAPKAPLIHTDSSGNLRPALARLFTAEL